MLTSRSGAAGRGAARFERQPLAIRIRSSAAYVDISPRQSLERYLSRDVTIVLGAQDKDSGALLLEVSPPAMAQGANRLERGICYCAHVRKLARAAGLTATHRLIELAGGHAARDILTAPQTREAMFG